ncbi:pI267L [African swine fever virus]|uniref:PI267L n=1 Tax=African swine fever virus TaxID=10497 RepID=A0A8A1V2K4_ASF|nr:pI267L [African swine fever virus]
MQEAVFIIYPAKDAIVNIYPMLDKLCCDPVLFFLFLFIAILFAGMVVHHIYSMFNVYDCFFVWQCRPFQDSLYDGRVFLDPLTKHVAFKNRTVFGSLDMLWTANACRDVLLFLYDKLLHAGATEIVQVLDGRMWNVATSYPFTLGSSLMQKEYLLMVLGILIQMLEDHFFTCFTGLQGVGWQSYCIREWAFIKRAMVYVARLERKRPLFYFFKDWVDSAMQEQLQDFTSRIFFPIQNVHFSWDYNRLRPIFIIYLAHTAINVNQHQK